MRRLRTARWLRSTAALIVATLAVAGVARAQSPPPARGTMALEGTLKTFYKALNIVVVTTLEGAEHVYHYAKELVVHGGTGTGVDALEGLGEGSTVVVHYTQDASGPAVREIDVIGEEGLETTEGIVTDVDRKHRQITVQYDNGTTEVFRLTERLAAENAVDGGQAPPRGTKVVIYYFDEHRQKVAHYFRKIAE